MAQERLPSDIEAERAVLTAMMVDSEAFSDCLRSLKPSDFSERGNSIIFQAMSRLGGEGTPVDLVLLCDRLKKDGLLSEVGGANYLAELQSASLLVTNTHRHCEILREKAFARKIVGFAEQLKKRALAGQVDTDKVVEQFRLTAEMENVAGILPIDLEEYETNLCRWKGAELVGFDTGFQKLNRVTRGLSGIWIVAGGPKTNKSTFVLKIASHVAAQEVPVLYYDLENGRQRIVERLHSRYSRIGSYDLRTGQYDDDEYARGMNELRRIQPFSPSPR